MLFAVDEIGQPVQQLAAIPRRQERQYLGEVSSLVHLRFWSSLGLALCVSASSQDIAAAGALQMRPNPSLKLTRYGRRRKAGPQPLGHHRAPALRRPPTRAP